MTPKQAYEIGLVKKFLIDSGLNANIESVGDKPDVVLSMDDRWIGLEVTALHPDEGPSGSRIRAAEERAAKERRLEFHWGSSDYPSAIERRFNEKIKAARGYGCSAGGALWLLISCQIPIPGQQAATYVLESFLRLPDLERFSPVLAGSRFDEAFIHLIHDGSVFCWRRASGWRLIEQMDHPGRRQRGADSKAVWDLVEELKKRPFPIKIVASYG